MAGKDNQNYFGAAWKNHTRYCKRIVDDCILKEEQLGMMHNDDDAKASLVEHKKARKAVSAIRAICAVVHGVRINP